MPNKSTNTPDLPSPAAESDGQSEREGTGEAPLDGTQAGPLSPERIAARAYEIYRERGGQHGHDMEDWLEAERELNGMRPQHE